MDQRHLAPQYHAVVAVDTKDFSGNPSAYQPLMSEAVLEVLQESFERAGLAEAWREARFSGDTGDGHFIGLETTWLPRVLHPWLDELQQVLERRDRELRRIDRNLRMRLRVSIHVGPLPYSGTGRRADGKGRPMNDTHRLLDSAPVRDALKSTHPDRTFVAAIISDRVYEDFIEARHTALPPELLRQVTATVAGKGFTRRAWLYVPVHSYLPSEPSAGEPPGPAPAPGPDPAPVPPVPAGGITISGNSGAVALGNSVGGDFRQEVQGGRGDG